MIEANMTIRSREEYGEAENLFVSVNQRVDTQVTISVDVDDGDKREVAIENRGGEVQLLIYAEDADAPVIVRLPSIGGIIIDREGYDHG